MAYRSSAYRVICAGGSTCKMMVSVSLDEWAWLEMSLHSGAAVVVRLLVVRFTEYKNKSASDTVNH